MKQYGRVRQSSKGMPSVTSLLRACHCFPISLLRKEYGLQAGRRLRDVRPCVQAVCRNRHSLTISAHLCRRLREANHKRSNS